MPRGKKNGRRLLNACRELRFFRVEKYLIRGANVNFKCKTFGRTPVMTVFYSIRNGEEEKQRRGFDVMKLLLDSGADPNIADKAGNILLIEVIKTFQVPSDFVALLLDAGADMHKEDSNGNSPMSEGLRRAIPWILNKREIIEEKLMELHCRQYFRVRRSTGGSSLPGLMKWPQELYLLYSRDDHVSKEAHELDLQLYEVIIYYDWPMFFYHELSKYSPLTDYEKRYMKCYCLNYGFPYSCNNQYCKEFDFNPDSLVRLCLVEVSMCVGFKADRNERISQTGLYPSLQRRLMFSKS